MNTSIDTFTSLKKSKRKKQTCHLNYRVKVRKDKNFLICHLVLNIKGNYGFIAICDEPVRNVCQRFKTAFR